MVEEGFDIEHLRAGEILSSGSSANGGDHAADHSNSDRKNLSRGGSFSSLKGLALAFRKGPPSLGRRPSNSLLEAELEEARQEIERLQAINQRLQDQVDDLTLFNSSLLKDVAESEKRTRDKNAANLPAAQQAAATAAVANAEVQGLKDKYDKLAQQLVQERVSHKAELSETKQALAMLRMGAARNAQAEQGSKGCACTIS